MVRIFGIWGLLALIFSVQGCAALEPEPAYGLAIEPLTLAQGQHVRADMPKTTPLVPVPHSPKISQLTEDLVYQILLGEISAQRGELGVAVESYKKATALSHDAQVAKRATKIAMYEGNVSALEVATQWAELDPTSISAQKTVAFLYFRIQDYDNALRHLRKLLTLNEQEKTDGYLFVANLLSQVSDRNAALILMTRLVDESKNDYRADFALAKLAVVAKNYVLAKKRVDKVLLKVPDDTAAKALMGRILVSAGKKQEALAYFQSLYEKGQADFSMKNTYARLLVSNKQYDQAKQVFQNLLTDKPKKNETIYALALLAMQTEVFEVAEQYLQVLEKAKFKPNEVKFYLGQLNDEFRLLKKAYHWYRQVGQGKYYFDARLRMVDLLALEGKITDSRSLLRHLRAVFPKLKVKLYLLEGDVLERANTLDAQMTVYNDALKEYPDNAEILYNRALLGEKIGRLDILERDLRKVLQHYPENANALNALGYTLAERTKRYDEALPLIQLAFVLKPDDAAVMDSMGWVQYKLGHLSAAGTYLRQAYTQLADGEIAAHLSEVLYHQGEKEEAKHIWQKAMDKEPNNNHLLELKHYF